MDNKKGIREFWKADCPLQFLKHTAICWVQILLDNVPPPYTQKILPVLYDTKKCQEFLVTVHLLLIIHHAWYMCILYIFLMVTKNWLIVVPTIHQLQLILEPWEKCGGLASCHPHFRSIYQRILSENNNMKNWFKFINPSICYINIFLLKVCWYVDLKWGWQDANNPPHHLWMITKVSTSQNWGEKNRCIHVIISNQPQRM
jgi:hypothetical protein